MSLKDALAEHTTGTEVEAAAPPRPVALLQSDQALTMIAESLPAGMDPKTFQRHAITLVKQTPQLLECDGASVAQGIVRGAALGLDPDPALGQMWLVPRSVKTYNPATRKDEWQKVATFQVGWRGLYELAMRTGRLAKVEVKAVHRHDRFEARLGSGGGLVHEPDWFGDRGPVIGWYAYAQLRDGTEMFEVLSRPEAEAHRDAYAPKNKQGKVYGPWADHFDAMAAKTVFIRLAKWLPKQVERDALTQAIEVDGTSDRTPLGGRPGPGDVIEASYVPEVAPAGPDEDVVDVEVIDEPTADVPEDPWQVRNRKAQAMVAKAWPENTAAERNERRLSLIAALTDGRATSSKQLDDHEWDALFTALDDIADGSQELHLNSNGAWVLRTSPTRKATS